MTCMTAHSRAAPNLQAHAREAPHNDGHQRGTERVLKRCTRTYFVENEHETLSLRVAPAHLLSTGWLRHPAGSQFARVENEDDDVGLVDGFVQHADVMPPQLFLRLGGCRRRLGRRGDEVVG